MKDFKEDRQAIRQATDAELLAFRDQFEKVIKSANWSAQKTAKKLKLRPEDLDRAAFALDIHRRRFWEMLTKEIKRRGLPAATAGG